MLTASCAGQTTQGLISGRVVDSQTGAGIAGAEVRYLNHKTNTRGAARADMLGNYALLLLPPGAYSVSVALAGYQNQELEDVEVPVSGRLDLDFRLRPLSDVWETGQYRSVFLPKSEAVLTFFGPDVDTSRFGSFEATGGRRGALDATLSDVVDPAQLSDLPLAGRDVYTLLVTQPAVTADTATARGLGLSVNGQRPSSSNFMLDGLENNNYLVTGPLMPIAPEAVQEYRVSLSGYSAEYGRTGGYLANAITRSGGSEWHALLYSYFKNEALNANGFQQNRLGLPESPLKEAQFGADVSGPVWKQSLFASGSFEHLRSRGRAESRDWILPSTVFSEFTAPDSVAARLLGRFPAPAITDRNLPSATLTLAQPVSVDHTLGLARFDYQPRPSHRLMLRAAASRMSRPDFIWTPYTDFVSGLDDNVISLAANLTSTLSPRTANELRAGWSMEDLHWDRAHPEIPTLMPDDGLTLPGSPAFYAYRNRSRGLEINDNVSSIYGRHVWKAGGGALLRRLDGFLTAGRDALYTFGDVLDFALDWPRFFTASVARGSLPALRTPDYSRRYGYTQYYLFAQDTFRAAPRLALNYGIRYENFGVPHALGAAKDEVVEPGAGSSFAARLAAARLVPQIQDELYSGGGGNWGVRFGFSYDLFGSASTLLRGAYGIFYDRPFDNLWQNIRNNSIVVADLSLPSPGTDYLSPVPSVLPQFDGRAFRQDFPPLTMFQPEFRDGYVQSYFLGVQRQMNRAWTLELNGLGALGRKLITTDQVNRPLSLPVTAENPEGRLNPALPPISYRGNQGASNYHALAVTSRFRARFVQFQASYTWSHSIDNQSDPLAGDFFDLGFVRVTSAGRAAQTAAFSRQFDSRADRGSSDFDQRHNLVFWSIWDLPSPRSGRAVRALFRGWKVSQLAAFRTGFPYSVSAPSRFVPGGEWIVNNRADATGIARSGRVPAEGGVQLIDPSAFVEPTPGTLGNTGRNAFGGPGLYSLDLSVSRAFGLKWLGETATLRLRADAFNVLNHANLNPPDSSLGSPSFGIALYGRKGKSSGFPALTPFEETGRQMQLMLRLEF